MGREMVDLAQRIERVEERGTLVAVLTDLEKALPSKEEWEQQYLLKALLSSSTKLTKLLTASEVQTRLSSIFEVCAAVPVLLSLYHQLCSSEEATETTIYRIFKRIESRLDEILLKSVEIEGDFEEKEQANAEVVACLVSLRDRATNFATSRLKGGEANGIRDWLEGYENRLFSAICSALTSTFHRVKAELSVNLKMISLLLSKGRHLQIKETCLVEHVAQWICRQQDSPQLWNRIAQRIFTDDSHGIREFEALVTAVVLAVDNGIQLQRCLGYALQTNECIRIVCTRRLLLQRVHSYSVVRVLAEFIALSAGDELFYEVFKNLVGVWADIGGVKYNPVEKQKYLTVAMLEFGRQMSYLPISTKFREISRLMIPGVHERIGSSDVVIRQCGMFVAETISGWQKDAERLKFDYHEDEWLAEMRRVATGKTDERKVREIPEEKKAETSLPDLSSLKLEAKKEADSDDEEEEFGGSFVPEEEKNFEEVKPGEEPEKGHAAPNYIRDAMDWLDEKERYERFEAGFFALEPMIRRKAVGFSDIGARLVLKLVYLSDRFASKRFEEIRRSALVACLVTAPDLAPALGDLIYARSVTFSTRYLILNVFLAASKELSDPPKPGPAVEEVKKAEVVDESDWRQVVDARIRAKTRIISEKKPAVATHVNRFASVATLFFYPLMRTSTEEHLQLRGRDAPFLAKMLFTAGEILQCATASASVVKMASDLNSLVAPLRFHEEPSLRAAVLFSYFSIATAVPLKVLVDVFSREIEGWLEWACSVAEDVDFSAEDRSLAQHVAGVLVEKLNAARNS